MSGPEPRSVRTREILDRITDAFFALDGEWRFTYVNERAEEMLERASDELVGQVIWDEFPETVETQFPEGFHRAMDTQQPVAFEVYHKPLDTWFEARAYPSESGLTASLRDVTDRKEHQRDLERYETVIEAVDDGVVTIGADNRMNFVNDAIATDLGMDADDLVGTHVGEVPAFASVGPDEAKNIGHALDALRRGDADDYRFEFSYTDPDDEERVAETRLVPVGDGEIAGVIRDVTEHREHERVVRSLHSITPKLLSAEDRLEICSVAVHAAGEVLDLKISGIWLLKEEYNRLDPVAATAGAHDLLGGLPHFPRGEGVVWDTFRTEEPALYDDVREHDHHEGDTPLRSEIVVPIGDHGVLMAGEVTPGALDDTDLELATILAANTAAALDRAEREQLLRRSKDTVERHNERLSVVESVLSGDLRDELAIAAREAEGAGVDSAVDALMRARRLAEDALELAKGEISVGPRTVVDVGDAAESAAAQVDGVWMVVEDDARLRADRDRLVRLFETVLLDGRSRSEGDGWATVRVGVLDDHPPGLYVQDDAEPVAGEEALEFDRVKGVGVDENGLGLVVAGEIAAAHGWDLTVGERPDGDQCLEIRGISTLSTE